ncbi:Hsp20/alpha crystallin family protein [Acidobacteria bacterium AH-259-A15]|nr:Hsp20/alpha crystallin family protein [Acidobacteria bacterium AH-259-A15]
MSVTTEKKGFILKSVDALDVSFVNPRSGASSKVWIVVKEPEKWQKGIFKRTKLQVSEDDIEEVASELDRQSRSVLLYVWQERYATTQELTRLYDESNHMEVWHRIRNIINPVSEKTVGFPILVFERSKTDPVRGEKVPFSWWIIGERRHTRKGPEPLMDIFDGEHHVIVVMELRGVREKHIQVKITGERLKFWCDSPVASYSEDILLPSPVDSRTVEKRLHNGILEMRLQKSRARTIGAQLKS